MGDEKRVGSEQTKAWARSTTCKGDEMRSVRNCSVAVTGGAGFLGSHLVDHLIEDRHCNVLVIDNLVAGRREFIHSKASFEHADITQSESFLLRLFKHYQVRFVFSYAAYPYIPD